MSLMNILLSQLLLDYNDFRKLPFYDVLDKMLNQDGFKLRYLHMLKGVSFNLDDFC
jgi:hypothetical protein